MAISPLPDICDLREEDGLEMHWHTIAYTNNTELPHSQSSYQRWII